MVRARYILKQAAGWYFVPTFAWFAQIDKDGIRIIIDKEPRPENNYTYYEIEWGKIGGGVVITTKIPQPVTIQKTIHEVE